jgi:hypothetical protein
VEAKVLVELQHLFARHGECRALLCVERIGIGHDGVEPVVAAVQFEQQQDARVQCRTRQGASRCAYDEWAGEGQGGGGLQEVTSGEVQHAVSPYFK